MAAANLQYKPQTKVEWGSNQAYPQFRMWRKEVERIINGPMFNDPDSVKLNTVYIRPSARYRPCCTHGGKQTGWAE